MWHRKSTLLFCLLLLFIFSSRAFCQTLQIAPIRGAFSADSAKAGTTRAQVPLHRPTPIGHSPVDPGKIAPSSIEKLGAVRVHSTGSAAQWVLFQFSGTKWDWRIRKPGTYASKVLVGSIQSNGEVSVHFEGFGELYSSGSTPGSLEGYYAISPPNSGIDQLRWMRPGELNAFEIRIDQTNPALSAWALWQRIIVEDFATANEFKDDATISIKLENNGEWVEPQPSVK